MYRTAHQSASKRQKQTFNARHLSQTPVENKWWSVLIEGALSQLNSDGPMSNGASIFLKWPALEQGLHVYAMLETALFCWTELALFLLRLLSP